ncbi:glycoside hydrolase superfamily [Xylariaceae sp. FL0016]|nr:glycoside hydrolase superfamily [Xylariaceae sp. FL0016]
MKSLAVAALVAFSFGSSVSADASANYTAQLLSSGTVKLGDWQDAYDRATALVKTLSTSEKLSVITGSDIDSFAALNKLDSAVNPLGYYFVTNWPAGLAMAMTWDRQAIQEQGKALGEEFRGKGLNFALGPTIAPLGRSAWDGRLGECYGSDSYLNGAIGAGFVRGISSAGVISSAKHYIMNEYETNRMGGGTAGSPGGGGAPTGSNTTTQKRQSSSSSEAYTVDIGDKSFHETYLAPFYDAVKEGIGGVMCGMNRINGTYACESQDLLAKYLKVELGFPGIVHADVSGQKTAVNSANAGMDLSDGNTWGNSTLGVALTNGSFTMARLNDMAVRNLISYYQLGQDKGYPDLVQPTDLVDVRGKHGTLARTYAADSIVLLKNKNNTLPLKNKKSVSIFGAHAGPRYMGPNVEFTVYGGVDPTLNGHMAQIGGSAQGSLGFLSTPYDLFNQRAAKDGFMLRWWLNDSSVTTYSGMSGGSGTKLTPTTIGVADNSDACVVFLNSFSSEGGDRPELANGTADALVNLVADNCNNTIVVINTVGPRLVDEWIEHENVTAVLYGGPLGQESGNAIDDVLFGAVNPSGKLVHTIAKNASDYDPNTVVQDDVYTLDFTEGNFIDYKYFDANNIEPRYEFGFGLSYTTFEYGSDATVKMSGKRTGGYATGARAVGGREDLWDVVATVTATVSNTGSVAGAEVAQLYVAFPDAADEPVRQLRGFDKVTIQPGKSATVSFDLKRRDLSIWDTGAQNWKMESGDYSLFVGASSRDLQANATITV